MTKKETEKHLREILDRLGLATKTAAIALQQASKAEHDLFILLGELEAPGPNGKG